MDSLLNDVLHAVVTADVDGDGGGVAAGLFDLAFDGVDGGLGRVWVRGEGGGPVIGVAG